MVAIAGTAAAATSEQVASPVLQLPPPPLRLGQSVTVTITPDTGSAVVPATYQYQINNGRTRSVAADHAGDAAFRFAAVTRTEVLTVWGLAADGERGPSVTRVVLVDTVDPAAANQDLTGDGLADLVVVGTSAGLGSGLWLAPGRNGRTGKGRLAAPAVNIAPDGPVGAGAANPAFDGSVALTGNFFGDGYQDVLAYYPGGANAGGGFLLHGSGDGSGLQPGLSGNEATLSSGLLSDLNGDNPIVLANAYNASGNAPVVPDLIAISGDPAIGYYLEYIPIQGAGVLNYNLPSQLPDHTPTGGTDWNNWRLFSTQLSTGTAVFVWNPTSGALYLWEGLSFVDNGDFTGSLTFTQYLISSNWNAGADVAAVEAADFTGDGVPDLWAVASSGVATPYVVSRLSPTGAAVITAMPAQDLR
jgi:hypothetical protein